MCLVLYMASTQECPTIPWNEDDPQFHVVAKDLDAEKTAPHFSKPEVYYLGSSDGCGCGFRSFEQWQYVAADAEDAKLKIANHQKLYDYVENSLSGQDFVELFSCWSGEEADPILKRRNIVVDELVDDDFFFEQSELTRVFKTLDILKKFSA